MALPRIRASGQWARYNPAWLLLRLKSPWAGQPRSLRRRTSCCLRAKRKGSSHDQNNFVSLGSNMPRCSLVKRLRFQCITPRAQLVLASRCGPFQPDGRSAAGHRRNAGIERHNRKLNNRCMVAHDTVNPRPTCWNQDHFAAVAQPTRLMISLSAQAVGQSPFSAADGSLSNALRCRRQMACLISSRSDLVPTEVIWREC
jgi:hypothetical protein